jgi:hypothetical protein
MYSSGLRGRGIKSAYIDLEYHLAAHTYCNTLPPAFYIYIQSLHKYPTLTSVVGLVEHGEASQQQYTVSFT